MAIQKTGLAMLAVYLYGSIGTVFMRKESDVELAFLSKKPLTLAESMAFIAALQMVIPAQAEIQL